MVELPTLTIRISLSLLIGGVIGYERSNRNSAAGLRTHILVAVAMTMVSLIQLSMNEDVLIQVRENPELTSVFSIDMGRLAAQAISGIGFIGAGTILHHRSTIIGLTTAASIWSVGVVGLAIGMGYYTIAIVGGIIIVLTLDTLSRFQSRFINRAFDVQIDIYYKSNEKVLESILNFMQKNNLEINRVEYGESTDDDIENIKYFLHLTQKTSLEKIVREIYYIHPSITSVEKYGY